MKTLYLDCGMGAAGDMLTAALLELHPDPAGFLRRLNALGLPGVSVAAERAVKCGVTGTRVSVTVNGEEEDGCDCPPHGHAHDHGHGHDHAHPPDRPHEHGHAQDHMHGPVHETAHDGAHRHSGMGDIRRLVEDRLDLPPAVKADILAVYGLIAEAESAVHGVPVTDIHFHEVGTLDAVADVTAVCLLLHELAPERVAASPVHVGGGQVRCAHGVLPVPAPATARILQGVPTYGGAVQGELCTPTGAALLKHFVSQFGPQPVLRVEKIGYGCGKKDFEAANCVRALLGETEGDREQVACLQCNLDDMTPEALGFAMETLFSAGALDVYTQPIGMKKSRPGVLLTCMCRLEDREAMVRLLFRHTTTLGVRESVCARYTLARAERTAETECGPVRVKTASGWGVRREKPEYEDLARIARERGLSLREAGELVKEEKPDEGI